MPNSKLKNLILLILALCCACLLALVIPTRLREQQQQTRTATQLTALYAAEGLSLPEEALPESLALQMLDAQLDTEAAHTAAQALLGSTLSAEDDTGSFQLTYISDLGTCSIRRGVLNAAFTDGIPVSGSLRRNVQKLMREMGFSVTTDPVSTETENGFQVSVYQSLLGVPIFSAELCFSYSDGALQSVEGACCPIAQTLTAASDSTCISCVDALVVFLEARDVTGWVGSEIISIQQGYLLSDTASASALRLVPVWRLETDTGIFFVNGITREVTSA